MTHAQSPSSTTTSTKSSFPDYILAGGQTGSWFTESQYPLLYKTTFQNGTDSNTVTLSPVPSQGTVWSGGWNGTNWLITGWGSGDSVGLNPYYDIYNSQASSTLNYSNYREASNEEQEWAGGDIFSATSGGSTWLLTGMGSGELSADDYISNHYSMAFLTSNGTFIDLSDSIPNNTDGILYASSCDGSDWLVGGGYYQYNTGVLLLVTPSGEIRDITSRIQPYVSEFNAVQSIGWNGTEWMIGGVGFLAAYNPSTGVFYDLTRALDSVLSGAESLANNNVNSVNAISGIDGTWMFAGGVNVAFEGHESQTAWVASLNSKDGTFADRTSSAIPAPILSQNSMSAILSMECGSNGCALGGFAGNNALLLWYNGTNSINLSANLQSMNYVQWVGISDPTAQSNGSALSTSSATTHHTIIPWPRIWHLRFPKL